jgi:hypothetical protein
MLMARRANSVFSLVFGCAAIFAAGQAADAQQSECRFFKVQPNSLNISKEPRGDAVFIDVLDAADIVCVTREQKVGDRDWAFIAHKLVKPDQQRPVEGWANLRSLQPATPAELAAPKAAAQPQVAAPATAPPPEDVIRYNEPLKFGPFPVNGSTIEQLIEGIPLFPPLEGLDESLWKKHCSACHKWDRQTLCEQGTSYAKNPRSALRHSHPYGGADKIALMQWAKGGCQ